MVKSVLPKTQKAVFIFSAIVSAAIGLCCTVALANQDWLTWSNRCLTEAFDPTVGGKLKKWELTLTDDAFIRLRKTYQTGKQEYFSFHLQRFEEMEYLGDTTGGTLKLKTKTDDIIVQTYNDKKGNVDTMASVLNIPVKNMEPERLDSLKAAFNYFKSKGL